MPNQEFTKYIKNDTEFQFYPIKNVILNDNSNIQAVMNIVFLDSYNLLALDKDSQWNTVCGHIENNETPLEALCRETQEEVGVKIKNQILIGYIKSTKLIKTQHNQKYSDYTQMPVYISFVDEVLAKWDKLETLDRILLNKKKTLELLSKRGDSNQLAEIFEHAWQVFKIVTASIDFNFTPNYYDKNITVTQVFNFCANQENNFCVVRDGDEKHFSLPGGGCDLGEKPETCCFRETMEEAQIAISNIELVGTLKVSYLDKNGIELQSVQHLRYMSKVDKIDDFEPYKNGFETCSRDFVSIEELSKKIDWLQYDSGKEMLKIVKNKL